MKKYITSNIDNKEYCYANGAFVRHLRDHNINSIHEYLIKFCGLKQEYCKYCNKEKKFDNRHWEYIVTCGDRACITAAIEDKWDDDKRHATGLKSKENRDNMTPEQKKTMYKKISDKNSARSQEEKDISTKKRKETMISKYGVENTMHIPEVKAERVQYLKQYWETNKEELRDKTKATNLERYGVENTTSLDFVQDKIKATNLERYGVERAIQNDSIKAKIKATNLERYGVENTTSLDFVQDKIKATCMRKYGVPSHMQVDEIKKKVENTYIERYGAKRIGMLHIDYEKVNNKEFIENLYNSVGFIDFCKELNASESFGYRCLRNHNISIKENFRSAFEHDVFTFISSLVDASRIKINQKFNRKEIDIVVDGKIGFECNGVYWHSEVGGCKDSKYHLAKTTVAAEHGISLMHIWDFDWKHNSELVKSKIKSLLGTNERIFARKCRIAEVKYNDCKSFLTNNHRQGHVNSKVNLGLYHDDKLVALMTFGKSRYNNTAEYEMLRYCSVLNTNVVGGASKLFSYFIKNYMPNSIISYSDKMFNNGKLYNALGFKLTSTSPPSAVYTKNYSKFFNRVSVQKHKLKDLLEHYDESLSAWENLKVNNWDRYWNCGNGVYMWEKQA